MKASATAFTLFSVNITWLHLLIGCSILFVLYIVFGLIREKTPRISLKTAFRDALRTAAAQPAALVKFLLTEACLIVICLTPLLLLTVKMSIWIPAALTAVCWFLLMNPARVNAAAAMQDSLGEGKLFSLCFFDETGGSVPLVQQGPARCSPGGFPGLLVGAAGSRAGLCLPVL